MRKRSGSASWPGSRSALAVAGWRLYQRRSIERMPSLEGIEDPAAARAYGQIMRLPHMALLRSFVARRATNWSPPATRPISAAARAIWPSNWRAVRPDCT